jgi:carbamoyl-phosphate synthase large subunit
MPKRTDFEKILVIGSGPIVIGQACEFDYSGTQAIKALREDGYEVVLVNSNPATIMTDPEFANRTYIEPLNVTSVARIIERERPDVILPTVGGQTALNLAMALNDAGVLKEFGVKLIGAKPESIRLAEDRRLFAAAMNAIGLETTKAFVVSSVADAVEAAGKTGYPCILRASFTLGGTGSGIAYNREELEEIARRGIEASPIHEITVEESILGWKEYELEVMRDIADNFVVVCAIENIDPMGVHTGDSITVAPTMTLTDVEYQAMRDAAKKIMRRIGVETGGSNVQFAVNPEDGRLIVIEMNPRVSRSSALASKATGFPIAKMAAKLAVGYTLNEISNDITKKTPACFEPSIDYHVIKIPRFTFEKFAGAKDILGTQMKSVGETMAIGRTFKEALQKGLRGLETGKCGFGPELPADLGLDLGEANLTKNLAVGHSDRLSWVRYAFLAGMSVEQVFNISKIDPWFLQLMLELVEEETALRALAPAVKAEGLKAVPRETLWQAKRNGFGDKQLGLILGVPELDVRAYRKSLGITPVYKTVDTCAAEFPASTPYHYSTYEEENESIRSDRKKIAILGGGPNRIGQGIEFDYCCVHASMALREMGFETIMINNNPETVSTDYDTSDKLYFEPLTLEDVVNIVEHEQCDGVIVQFGGQTPLKLALALKAAGVPIIGTSPDDIDVAEDRERFGELAKKLGIKTPPWGIAWSLDEAKKVANEIGYPALVRPSYVLGGRAMAVVYDEDELANFFVKAQVVSEKGPVLIDRFLEDAFEADVDCLADGEIAVIAGLMQHIEEAGVHSGDSACVLPSYLIPEPALATMREQAKALAMALNVRGLMNVQFAIRDNVVYVLEVNPRASRTVPFVSKATGVPVAKIAAKLMAGATLTQLGLTEEPKLNGYFVKESVFPFKKFPGVDTLLGPEMRSTGEVMGVGKTFGTAFAKSQLAAGFAVPTRGTVFITVNDNDKKAVLPIAGEFQRHGFQVVATTGTAKFLNENGIKARTVYKYSEARPNAVDGIKNGEIDIVINTPFGRSSYLDEIVLRRACYDSNVLLLTTLSAAKATLEAIHAQKQDHLTAIALQDLY